MAIGMVVGILMHGRYCYTVIRDHALHIFLMLQPSQWGVDMNVAAKRLLKKLMQKSWFTDTLRTCSLESVVSGLGESQISLDYIRQNKCGQSHSCTTL